MVNEDLLSKPIWQMTGEEFLTLLELHLDKAKEEVTVEYKQSPKHVYGIRGIANILDCSISTANRVKKSGILDEAIIQVGRTIIVDKEKAFELLKNQNFK